MHDLLSGLPVRRTVEPIDDGAVVLRGFVSACASELLREVELIRAAAPFRHLTTPGGHVMSVAMTNCGDLGWVSDRRGYRYQRVDPLSGQTLARDAGHVPVRRGRGRGGRRLCAVRARGVSDQSLRTRRPPFVASGSRRADLDAPIVSVSLGLPAVFLFGGLRRNDRPRRIRLEHGDVVVWGGPTRLAFHGVEPLDEGLHAVTGRCRINLTFRKAG